MMASGLGIEKVCEVAQEVTQANVYVFRVCANTYRVSEFVLAQNLTHPLAKRHVLLSLLDAGLNAGLLTPKLLVLSLVTCTNGIGMVLYAEAVFLGMKTALPHPRRVRQRYQVLTQNRHCSHYECFPWSHLLFRHRWRHHTSTIGADVIASAKA